MSDVLGPVLTLVLQQSILSFQSISPNKAMQWDAKTLPQDKLLIRETHPHCITKRSAVRALTGRSRQVSEAQGLPLTLQPLELRLKVPYPSTSHIFCPLSSLCTEPWDAECTLSNSADSEKQRVKVQRSALNLRPLRFTHDISFLCRASLPTGSTGVLLSSHSNSSFYVPLSM